MKSKRAELSSEFSGSAFPIPLASRRFCKRKRTIEFLFDTQPPTGFHLSTEWPINPPLSSQASVSAPVEKEITTQAVRSSSVLDFKSLDSEKDAASSISSNINREPSVAEVNIPENDKVEENFSISKLVAPVPPQPAKSETLTGGTAKIIEALQVLGKATGHQIANWISKRYGDALFPKKKLSYIVNSILSNKKNASLFLKDNAVVDGQKRTIWRLVDEDVHDMLSPMEYEDLPVVVDEAAMEAFEEQEEEPEVAVEVAPSPPKPVKKEKENRRLSAEPMKRKREDEEKDTGHHTVEDEPKLRALTPTKEPEQPLKTERTHPPKKHDESESDTADIKPMAIEADASKETDQISPPKTKRGKTRHEAPEDEPKPDKPEDLEQYGSFDDLSELDKVDRGSEDWRKRAKARIKSYSSRRKNKVDDDTGSPSASPSFQPMHSEAIVSSNNNSTYNSEDSMDPEGSTYTEMIEQALRALGGRGTGTEITSYIDENYHDVLSNKTKTWKNSVMGCLSANRRKLFAKEPVKEHAKRYVWRLNDPSLNLSPPEPLSPVLNSPTETSPVLHSKKRKSTSPHPKPEPEPVVPEVVEEKEDEDVELLPRKKMEKKKDQKEAKEKPIEEEKKEEIPSPEGLDEEEESDNDDFEESADEPRTRTKKDKKKSKLKGGDDKSLISLIETALSELGGTGTGMEVTDWILARKDEMMVTTVIAPDLCANKKKLNYTVNATLSSKKYRNIFVKDTSSTTGRAVWKLVNKK